MSKRVVGFERNGVLRYCDLCGGRYRANELVRGSDNLFRCLALCAPETNLIEVAQKEASAHYRHEAPPPPYGQSYGWNQTWPEEGTLFNYLAADTFRSPEFGTLLGASPLTGGYLNDWSGTASNDSPDHSRSWSAAETVHYLIALVNQGKRPASWLATARAKILPLLTQMLAYQATRATHPILSGSFFFGESGAGSLLTTITEARCGHAMLKAFTLLGTAEYLTAAKLSMRWLVNAQRCDLLTAGFTSSSPGNTTRTLFGGYPRFVYPDGSIDATFYAASSFAVLAFQKDLFASQGDGTYGDNVGGQFTGSPATLLSTSMATCRAFWTVGAYDTNQAKNIVGLSATTPREGFWARDGGYWQNDLGQPWPNAMSVSGWNYGFTLRFLYDYEGTSAQGKSVYDWLMSFGSNPTWASSAAIYEAPTAESTLGTYVPATALATSLSVDSKTNVTSNISPFTLGCLAPWHAVYNQAALDTAKQTLVLSHPYDAADDEKGFFVPGMFFQLGLGFQMFRQFEYGSVAYHIANVALFSNCFRYGQTYGGVQ